jgi:hypothetical protein
MTVLAVLVVLFGGLAFVNLALTLAVVRRLRSQSETLTELVRSATPDTGLPPGTPVPVLTAVADDGAEVSSATTGGDRLLAFVSSTCPSCRIHLPAFVATAGGYDRADVTVVVSGDPVSGADLVDTARPVARVVVEDDEGPWTRAFDVRAFPTFLRVHDGVVVAAGVSPTAVAQPVPA